MYVHIPKRVCDGGVKNRGWGWKSGQKRPDLGKKRPHRAIVRKACKIALEWGQKKSIIVVVASAQLDILRQKVSPVAGSGFCVRSDGAPEATVNPTNLTCSVYSDVLLFMDQSKTNCSLRSSAPRPGPHWHAQHHHRGLRQLLGGGYFVG